MKKLSIIKEINKDKYLIFSITSLLSVIIWYFNFEFWQNQILYFFIFFIYVVINSSCLGKILGYFGFEEELQFIFGIFALLYLIAFGMAIPIVFFKITPVWLLCLLLCLSLILSFISKKIKYSSKKITLIKSKFIFKVPKANIVFGVFFWLFFFFLLFYSRTGQYIRSPWTVIHPLYLYAWAGIIFMTGCLVFSKIKLKYFLIIIVLMSFLTHAYLLIPYKSGFGGDKWRHIGAAKSLMQGNAYKPSLLDEEITYKEFGSFKIPEVFIAGNKTSYANMWGMTIALSWLLGVDVFYIDLILGIILFSLFLPYLLLKIGSFISQKKTFLFLFVLSSFLFYPLQAYASITVPMSFAFLPFLFSLIFLLKYFSEKFSSKKLFYYLLFFSIFLYFNYILYLILFIEILFLLILFKNISFKKLSSIKIILLLVGCFMLLLFFIPILDTYNNYSWFKDDIPSIGKSFKEFSKNILYSNVIFPRSYGFEQDNWLYATTGLNLSRSILSEILPWNFILTPLLWVIILFGIIFYKKLKQPKIVILFLFLLILVFASQMIATYFMEGNHIFSKRLVIFSSFLVMILLSWGGHQLVENLSLKFFSFKAIVYLLALFFSLVATSVYMSGPKFQVVTADEYQSAKYVWQAIESEVSETGNACVLANTWPLLALEAVSSRQILTGGFPFYYEYRQPERVQLFQNMNESPSVRYLDKSIEITKSKNCYFMTESRWILFDKREEIVEQIDKIIGGHINIGKVMIWKYQPNHLIKNSL